MKDFKFLTEVDESDAIEPIGLNQTEPPQIYTEMYRMNVPINEMTEDRLNDIKMSQQRLILEQLSNTLDFRHEIVFVDGTGFTLRTELFI